MRNYVPKISALVAIIIALTSCAASQRESTIKAALITVDAARDGFIAYDSSRQAAIVAAATSLEQGKAALVAYRADRAKFETAFSVAYRAIGVAATLNDEQSLASMQTAITQVLAAIAEVTGGHK